MYVLVCYNLCIYPLLNKYCLNQIHQFIYLQIGENKQFSSTLVDYLETQYFMDPEAALINEENKQECVANVSRLRLIPVNIVKKEHLS